MSISPKVGGFPYGNNKLEHEEIAASGDRYPIHSIVFSNFSEEEGVREPVTAARILGGTFIKN